MYLILFCDIVFLKNISLIFLSPTKQMLNMNNRDASVVGVGSIKEF